MTIINKIKAKLAELGIDPADSISAEETLSRCVAPGGMIVEYRKRMGDE